MTTTIMKNSMVGDAWIIEACRNNPITYQGDGRFRSCPVRLSYPDLFEAKTNRMDPSKPPKFSTAMLFPPHGVCDLSPLYQAAQQIGAAAYAENMYNGQLHGVEMPFTDQAKKMQSAGYTPGCIYLNAKGNFKPRVVDVPPAMNDIIDQRRVYPGVWAIVSFNFYATKPPHKRIAVGLDAVMIYGDDTPLGGAGQVDVQAAFGGVKSSAPIAVPMAAFGGAAVAFPGQPQPHAGYTQVNPQAFGQPAPQPYGQPMQPYGQPAPQPYGQPAMPGMDEQMRRLMGG
jgi:hypothetical protein